MATADNKTAEVNWDELRPQLIKVALELGPLIVFFIVNAPRRHLRRDRLVHGRDGAVAGC